ncbi:Urease accessory protein UreG [Paraburkholderia saeva]|nr:Urease accessory protein UreG [Paraburkholderia saeva]
MVGANPDVMASDAKKMRGERPFVMCNLKALDGLADIIAFLEKKGGTDGLSPKDRMIRRDPGANDLVSVVTPFYSESAVIDAFFREGCPVLRKLTTKSSASTMAIPQCRSARSHRFNTGFPSRACLMGRLKNKPQD